MTDLRDSSTGRKLVWGGTNDAAHVRPFPGPQTQSRNRNQISVADAYNAATNSMTWNVADNITELTIYPTAAQGTGTVDDQNDCFVAVCFNAGNDGIAAAWLDLTLESETQDVQWYKIPIGKPTVVNFTNPVFRADFAVQTQGGVGYTAGSTDIWVGAN